MLRRFNKSILPGVIIFLLLSSLDLLFVPVGEGDYNIEISYTPLKPKLDDKMTVTATISPYTNITRTNLKYALCTQQTCGLFKPLDMEKVSDGVYRTEIGPFDKDKNYVEVKLLIELELSDNSTYSSSVKIVHFDVEKNEESNKGLPIGTEVIFTAIALSAVIVIIHRRRIIKG